MRTIIIAIHLMIVVALVVIVLLQRSEGGALGIGGSSGGFLTGRGQANVLTRATAILGGLFFLTSIALTLESNLNRPRASILSTVGGAATPASGPAGAPPATPTGNLLNQLQQIQQQRGAQSPAPGAQIPAPAAPASAPPAGKP